MSALDQFIASWFPDYAMRRVRARSVVAAYEAAKQSRLRQARRESRGPNQAVREAAVSIREQARQLEQNSDIARSAFSVMVANVVGMGIAPEPQIRRRNGELHEELNETLTSLYRDWKRRPEVTWTLDEPAAQRLAVRTALRDGEVFLQHLVGPMRSLQHGTQVPYGYELIEPEYVPTLLRDAGRNIEQGVEMNAWGRPIAYHVLRRELVEEWVPRLSLTDETRRLDARRVTHLAHRDRIRQVRGVSLLAHAISRIEDINEIDETERVAARIAAAMAAVIKKGDPYAYVAPKEDREFREIEFQPGMVIDDLEPGEEMQSIVSNRPNNALIPFRQDHLRALASGLGVGYSSLSRSYDGNFSAQRQELVEQHMHYGLVWSWVVAQLELPKWREFIDGAVVGMPDVLRMMADADPITLVDCDFSRPVMPWVDPLKEIKAIEAELGLQLTTKSAVMRSRGRDPREVARQRAIEQEMESGNAPGPDEEGEEDGEA